AGGPSCRRARRTRTAPRRSPAIAPRSPPRPCAPGHPNRPAHRAPPRYTAPGPSCRQRWAPGPRPRAPHARLVSLHRLPFPRMSLRSWSIALLLLLPGALCATDPPPWTVGVRGLGGFIVPHHPRIRLVQDRHALGGELFIQRWFSGRREWHGNYLRPAWGVSALWMRTGSDRMGAAVRVLPYLELPLRAPG